jgi:hypothetical protein
MNGKQALAVCIINLHASPASSDCHVFRFSVTRCATDNGADVPGTSMDKPSFPRCSRHRSAYLVKRLPHAVSIPSHAQKGAPVNHHTIYSDPVQVTYFSCSLCLSFTQQRSRDRPVIPVRTAGVAPFRRSATVLSPRLLNTPLRSPVSHRSPHESSNQHAHRSGVCRHRM